MYTFVYDFDWMGIYRDGDLVYQGHSIGEYELCQIMGIPMQLKHADSDWMREVMRLPDKLSEVKTVE